MMMLKTAVADDDWASLSDEWQAAPAAVVIDALQARVHAQGRRMLAVLVLELLLTVAGMVVLVLGARDAQTRDAWAVIGGLTVFTMVVWGFNLRNRRGTWRAAAETLEGYQALEILRRRRRLAAAVFARRLVLVCLLPLAWLAWERYQQGGGRIAYAPVLTSLGAMLYLVVWALAAWRLERRLRA